MRAFCAGFFSTSIARFSWSSGAGFFSFSCCFSSAGELSSSSGAGEFIGIVSHEDVGCDRRILQRLTRRRVVLRHREHQRRAVFHLDDLLDRPRSKRLVADDVTACVLHDRRRHKLRRAGRAAIHQHHQRNAGGDCLLRVGIKRLLGIRLALQIGNGSVIQEQVRCGDAFVLVAGPRVAQVEHQFLGSGLSSSFSFAATSCDRPLGKSSTLM